MTSVPGNVVERAKPIEEGGVVFFQQYVSKVEIESLKVNHWFALYIENPWPSLDNHSRGYQYSNKQKAHKQVCGCLNTLQNQGSQD